ncbi:MAG: hypothetical protein N5P05_000143 [Chroococcopsis gigantea SAG 12.99]|jgi:TM2 domain-containing membrane protein YozV|nr:SHOCT domain-containing protein [Chlorogloea purpurea SAG 13.99]MDV2998537.1 hypothetical protein [Chroococcopsis gigantea SAG 12.99]
MLEVWGKISSSPKSRQLAIALALGTSILALPVPIAGIHKFYLGQPLWGIIYLLLWQTPIPRIACAIDAVWYFLQGTEGFLQNFSRSDSEPATAAIAPQKVQAMAVAIRELEQLRQDGLISEYEFEQKRRQLLL